MCAVSTVHLQAGVPLPWCPLAWQQRKRCAILARILLKVGLNLQRQDMLKREAARKDVSLLSSVRPRRLPNRVQIEDAIPFFKSHEDFWGGSLAQRSTEDTQRHGGCENQEGRAENKRRWS